MKAQMKNNAYSMDKFAESGMKQVEDMMSMGKESTDAIMKSGSIFAKGVEEMMKACMSRAQSCGEKNANVWKSLMACKTINEFAEAQNRIAQESFEDAMNATAQMSEMSVKMMMDAFEPLNKQMSAAMKKANDSIAA
ncbi:MAG: phasin family protein [Rhodospirillales bacterium]|nr:phasin family protein [Rhodospirillales bacterium]USO07388.1 MAG: phasin family protein [Rhodospirillales bacterium]